MKKIVVLLYLIFLFSFSVFSYVFVDPNLTYLKSVYSGFAFSNRSLATIFYSLSIVVFFIFYGIFIYLGAKKKLNLKEIFMILGTTTVILFFSYPAMLSYDIFNYIATSKVLFFYQENPYVVMPIEFTGDPLLGFTHAANKLALYGPFWIILTGIPYLLGFGNFIVTLFNFKLFIIVFYFLTSIMIQKISRNILPLILFSLNPLVVVETIVSGHNDIVMMFLVLFSFHLLLKKKMLLGTIFFALSVLIKYATIFLLPVFFFMIWRIVKKKEIDLENIFYYSSLLMYVIFFLSPIREEIYPWYAIWFLIFSSLVSSRKVLLYISIVFSFALLFRYVPFMFSGTHAGLTPLIKSIITFLPPLFVGLYLILKKKIWGRI